MEEGIGGGQEPLDREIRAEHAFALPSGDELLDAGQRGGVLFPKLVRVERQLGGGKESTGLVDALPGRPYEATEGDVGGPLVGNCRIEHRADVRDGILDHGGEQHLSGREVGVEGYPPDSGLTGDRGQGGVRVLARPDPAYLLAAQRFLDHAPAW
jgi:hypothetical protein